MADYQFGQSHANTSTAVTATGYESLTSNFEFVTITVANDIRTIAQGGSAGSQAALDKLIQIVSTRGQPVIMGAVAWSSPNSTVLLAIEHPYAWEAAENTGTLVNSTGTAFVAGFADPRVGENLANRIIADGTNYSFSGVTVAFSGTLT